MHLFLIARLAFDFTHSHRVIRFSNDEVHRRLDAVLEAIRAACERFAKEKSWRC